MNPTLELVILAALRPHAQPVLEEKLFIPVNQESPTPVTRADLTAHLRDLASASETSAFHTRDGVKWIITTAGRARLAEAGL